MPIRIQFSETDWFPVQTFFNSIPDMKFIQTIKELAAGIGRSFDVCHCEFPDDLEPGDEPFEGVRFSIFEQEIILSRREFASALLRACNAQKSRRPDQASSLDDFLLHVDEDGRLQAV